MAYCIRSLWNNTYQGKSLTLCMLGKNFSRQHFETVFLFFLENRIWHFTQIVFCMSVRSYFLGKKKIRKMTSVCHPLNLPVARKVYPRQRKYIQREYLGGIFFFFFIFEEGAEVCVWGGWVLYFHTDIFCLFDTLWNCLTEANERCFAAKMIKKKNNCKLSPKLSPYLDLRKINEIVQIWSNC